MKTIKFYTVPLSFLTACLLTAAQPNKAAAQDQAPPKANEKASDKPDQPLPAPEQAPAAETNKPAEAAAPAPATAAAEKSNGEKGLRLNFRGVPLEMVLSYLSDAAGFVIVPEVDVRGKVDIWSNQPLTKEEAVEVLNSALKKNGYAALRQGRTLKIVTLEAAKREDIPVISGNDPENIPRSDEIVTQIIPVRSLNAVQLVRDLQPLIPEKTTITANESGNSLVITDNQTNIRRITEIVKALDTAMSSVSTIRVFPLKYADSKAVATVIKEVFQSSDASSRSGNDLRNMFFSRLRGGGPGGPDGGGDRGSDGNRSSGSSGRTPVTRVVATSDERSNSLVVSAPDDLMPTIADLVTAVDTSVEDLTEVRVFKLKYSDPTEMAELLTNLFPDETKTGNNNNFGSRFGFFGGGGPPGSNPGRGNSGASSSNESDRAKKQSRVIAVPDQRTASVVVSTSHDLMRQIEMMVAQLDAEQGRNRQVRVFDPKNADPQVLQQVLQELFQTQQNTRNTRSSANQNSALSTRSTQTQTPQNNNTIGGGNNTGIGGGGGNSGRPQ
jgi:general secretion pathway protein D